MSSTPPTTSGDTDATEAEDVAVSSESDSVKAEEKQPTAEEQTEEEASAPDSPSEKEIPEEEAEKTEETDQEFVEALEIEQETPSAEEVEGVSVENSTSDEEPEVETEEATKEGEVAESEGGNKKEETGEKDTDRKDSGDSISADLLTKAVEQFEKKGRQPNQGRNWYAIHTYSGYEDAVKKALEVRIENLNMQDKIFEVLVPKETEIVMRRGKPVELKKCLFPGYVLVDMIVTDDSWYVVRNTPNVTGFVGSGNIPVPVSPEEFGVVKSRIGSEEPKFKAEFKPSDVVKIMKGPFATFEGKVDSVDTGKGTLTVLVKVFDRDTPVELNFDQVSKK